MVTLTLNGRVVEVDAPDDMPLLWVLRDTLRLTGTKFGCGLGQCGACTVIVNGIRINSCLTLAAMHDGDSVTTIEGLGTPDAPSPLQRAFLEHDGFQCGYCTPGQICSATAMIEELANEWPSDASGDLNAIKLSDEEIRERMSGNICRCGAYSNIAEAMAEVAGA